MNTLIILGVIVAVVMLIVVAAYISVLKEGMKHYKIMADRYEELYFSEMYRQGASNEVRLAESVKGGASKA